MTSFEEAETEDHGQGSLGQVCLVMPACRVRQGIRKMAFYLLPAGSPAKDRWWTISKHASAGFLLDRNYVLRHPKRGVKQLFDRPGNKFFVCACLMAGVHRASIDITLCRARAAVYQYSSMSWLVE
jgi:hypothetical protein